MAGCCSWYVVIDEFTREVLAICCERRIDADATVRC